MKKKILISLILICMLFAPISVFAEETQLDATLYATNYTPNVTFKYKQESQEELSNAPDIGCNAAYVAEPSTGKILYEKNAHVPLFPASTTKILTALVVMEKCDLNEKAKVSQRALDLVPSGYSNAKLQAGEELTVKDLLYALLIPSANEAANVLAEHVSGSVEEFAEVCNTRAKELGCENLHFVNPNGIHNEDHYCTAYDLYLIAKECKKHDIFNEIVKTTKFTLPATDVYTKGDRTFTNTNELLIHGKYYYEYCNGIKTGYTTPAGQCLVASSSNDGLDLISVVLGGETNNQGLNERFYDTKKLFEFVYDNYLIKTIAEYGDKVAKIYVGKATKATSDLDVIVDSDISTVVPNSLDKDSINTSVSIDENIVAPIKENQVLGQITYYADGLEYTTNLIAGHSVEKLPYTRYNFIIVGIAVTTVVILILLFAIFRKHKKVVLIFAIIVIILECIGAQFIYKEGKANSITKVTLVSELAESTEENQSVNSEQNKQ